MSRSRKARPAPIGLAPPLQACVAVLLLALAFPAAAEEPAWDLGGSLSHRSSLLWREGSEGLGYGSASTAELGLRVKGEGYRAEVSAEAGALTGLSAAGAMAAAGLSSDYLVSGSGELALAARLRTLFIKLDLGPLALSAGRQVVNYGRGRFWSPVDIFSELDYSGLSVTRRGSDLIRLRMPLGGLSGAELVLKPKGESSQGDYAARLSSFIGGVDAGVLGAWEGEEGLFLIGGELKADLVAGFYAEGLYRLDPDTEKGSLQTLLGADWSVGDLILAAEYYRNDGGAATDPAFPAKNYLGLSAAYALSDFVAVSGGLMAALGKEAMRATLSLRGELTQASSLSAYLDGARGSFSRGGDSLSLGAGLSLAVKF